MNNDKVEVIAFVRTHWIETWIETTIAVKQYNEQQDNIIAVITYTLRRYPDNIRNENILVQNKILSAVFFIYILIRRL